MYFEIQEIMRASFFIFCIIYLLLSSCTTQTLNNEALEELLTKMEDTKDLITPPITNPAKNAT